MRWIVAVFLMSSGLVAVTAPTANAAPVTWTRSPLHPPLIAGTTLADVSCAGPAFCVAVQRGDHQSSHAVAFVQDGASWTIRYAADDFDVELDAVSCSSASFCLAVGKHQYGTSLALAWDGRRWRAAATPPRLLDAIDCVTDRLCFAVGGAEILRWRAGSWTPMTAPTPPGGHAWALTSISCSDASACSAVGYARNDLGPARPLAEVWDGDTWRRIRVTPPTGTPGNKGALLAVSCPALDFCAAVGTYSPNRKEHRPLALLWDGTTWTAVGVPDPATGYDRLLSVSCATAASCLAVGNGQSPGLRTIADVWDGAAWTTTVPAVPGDANKVVLGAADCTAAAACIAVGYRIPDDKAPSRSLIENFDGNGWLVQDTPDSTLELASTLSGVSCVDESWCIAVGSHRTTDHNREKPLIQKWNGTRWTPVASPSPPPLGGYVSTLYSVSCPRRASCTAVGAVFQRGFTPVQLIEHWDGTRWSIVDSPGGLPFVTQLRSVSCATTSSCLAIGYSQQTPGANYAVLAEQWDGLTWTVTPTPNADISYLHGISCTTASACTAVGSRSGRHGSPPLAERWNGAQWTATVLAPSAGSQSSNLNDVSCPALDACVAVGQRYTGTTGPDYQPIARTWDGTDWHDSTLPAIDLHHQVVLDGVSCTSSTSCTAVGSGYAVPRTQVLIENYDGTTWTRAATPPAGWDESLYGVSCGVDDDCLAVGSIVSIGHSLALHGT